MYMYGEGASQPEGVWYEPTTEISELDTQDVAHIHIMHETVCM